MTTQPSRIVSGAVSSTIPNSTNRNVSDSVPVTPGTLMRIPEAKIATAKKPAYLNTSGESHCQIAIASAATPRAVVMPM